jgi:hypothetical protein
MDSEARGGEEERRRSLAIQGVLCEREFRGRQRECLAVFDHTCSGNGASSL